MAKKYFIDTPMGKFEFRDRDEWLKKTLADAKIQTKRFLISCGFVNFFLSQIWGHDIEDMGQLTWRLKCVLINAKRTAPYMLEKLNAEFGELSFKVFVKITQLPHVQRIHAGVSMNLIEELKNHLTKDSYELLVKMDKDRSWIEGIETKDIKIKWCKFLESLMKSKEKEESARTNGNKEGKIQAETDREKEKGIKEGGGKT